MPKAVPHPIPYQGSKRNLATRILAFFPKDAPRLIEPFAGSAAVSIAARYYGKVQSIILGDSDESLISLWTSIVDNPEALALRYHDLWHKQQGHEKAFYNQVRGEFNETHHPDHFLYLLARCVKAAVRYNGAGEFNQSPDNRRMGVHPDTMKKQLMGASALLCQHSEIICADYRETLSKATIDDIVYLDPPYQGVCKQRDPRYRDRVTLENFINALDELNSRRVSFIVSYDGRTENKTYGEGLPSHLDLTHIEINAGRSSQATLLGRVATTYESLYLSPALVKRIHPVSENGTSVETLVQLAMFGG